MNTQERPELVWHGAFRDVLSMGFVAQTDPTVSVHRLARLFDAAWIKGEAVEATRDHRKVVQGMGHLLVACYEPSWGGGSSAEVIARVDSRNTNMVYAAGMVLRGPKGMELPELTVGYEPEHKTLVGDVTVPSFSLEGTGGTGIDVVGHDVAHRATNFYAAVRSTQLA